MNVVDRTLSLINKRRNNVINNIHNSIPSPFKRFSSQYIGIERGTYYLITASTKVGKSQLANYLFLFSPVLFTYKYPKVKFKLFYFPLEETPERITSRFISYLLHLFHNIEVDYKTLMSSYNNAISEDIINLIKSDPVKSLLDHFSNCITFVEDERNPTGIYNYIKKYMEDNGTITYKTFKKEKGFGEVEEIKKFHYYTPNEPTQYTLFMVDHASLLNSERGYNTKQTMDKLSEYCVELRNRYQVSPVIVQQQSFAETADNFKIGLTRPSLTNLSDSRYLSRDSNIVIGIYSPYRMRETSFLGYDITKFKDTFRSIEILANRDGEVGGIIGLHFNGKVCDFKELPRPTDPELQTIYDEIDRKEAEKINPFNNQEEKKDKQFIFFTYCKNKIKHLINN